VVGGGGLWVVAGCNGWLWVMVFFVVLAVVGQSNVKPTKVKLG